MILAILIKNHLQKTGIETFQKKLKQVSQSRIVVL